jgi:uncharacterized surface protein with fasciclin (FAS1) repeats
MKGFDTMRTFPLRLLAGVLAAGLLAGACTSATEETTTTTTATTEAPAADIVDTAIAAGQFETLATALQAADLVDTLKGEGPFTVFAPTDEAFAALPEGTLESLLDDIPALTDILLYHVVSGEVLAADVVNLTTATTVQGSDVSITVDGEMVKVDEANIVTTNIIATNGVIHVIDAVILP